MAISPISTNSLATASYVNPYAKTEQATAVPQINQDAQKAPQAAKTDTVTISKQALQMTGGTDTGAKETGESTTKQQNEAISGKK